MRKVLFLGSSDRTNKIFLTGATGLLGQFLATALLKEGNFLTLLARRKGDLTAEERISSALAFANTGTHYTNQHNYRVAMGDLDSLPGDIEADEIYNVAGSTSFAESERDRIFRTNLKGTENILNLARKIRPSKIHHISTSYVCASRYRTAYEKPVDCLATYENPYAKSKCLTEHLMLKFGEENPECEVFIYRPSIIVGQSWDGATTNFRSYYRFMNTFWCLGGRKRNGSNSEIIEIPIWVPGNPDAEINIVTIDYVINLMMMIRKKNVPGIYHLTNPNPPTYGWLLEESLKVFNMSGPSPLIDPNRASGKLKALQSRIAKGVGGYTDFVTDDTHFDTSMIKKVLGPDYYNHPETTPELVRTLLRFAISCEFNKEKALELVMNNIPKKCYFPPLASLLKTRKEFVRL